jgi:hypothetical protein
LLGLFEVQLASQQHLHRNRMTVFLKDLP